MNKINFAKIPYPGLRNIKTGISIFFCLTIYEFTNREGVLLAAIAAIICMQDSVEKSVEAGKIRIFGTIIGGLFGIIFTYLNFDAMNYFIWNIACVISVILLIYIINIVKMQESIAISCLVYLIIVLEPGTEAAYLYSIHRILDTLAGIVVAILVNRWFFRPKPDRIRSEGNIMNLDYEIIKAHSQKISKWSGGRTREIFISPRHSLYAERDFNWRISTAVVESEESKFTKLPGYLRHIMVLQGKMRLIHEGQHTINLEEFEQDFFSAEWDTHSFGKCTDFNIMLKNGYIGLMEGIYNSDGNDLVKKMEDSSGLYDNSGLYILEDKVSVVVSHLEKDIFNYVLNKGDFVIFNQLNQYSTNKIFIKLSSKDFEDRDIIAIRVDISNKTDL